jgi:phosphotriesterase-related protein
MIGMAGTIQTVKGPVKLDSLGLVLPHEHLFTDLRGPQVPEYARADPQSVVQVVRPFLEEASAAGVTALVECSTVGVGRNVDVLCRLAEVTPIHVIAPTGVYRDAYIPASLRDTDEEELADLWIRELTDGIAGSSVRAGFIKLAMSDDGPTRLEIRNLRAAARASMETGAVIASHTIGGNVAMKEINVLEQAGLDLRRFIWVHAQTEPDLSILLEAARRGVYLELDSVGAPYQSQVDLLAMAIGILEAGFVTQLLLSHDAGWYNPGSPYGLPDDGYRGYTALVNDFIPELLKRGATEESVQLMTSRNPANAFAF